MSFVRAVVDWAGSSPIIDGVVFGRSDGLMETPVCAVAIARGFRGFGKGITKSEALVSAVGEALEQYAASQVAQHPLIRSTFHEVAGPAFDPTWLCLYTDAQYDRPGFPYQRFSPDTLLHWVRGCWLDSGEPVWLPAFAVYLTGDFEHEMLCQVTSNGLAAGANEQDAAGRAACELYERDAFMTSWIALEPAIPTSISDLDPPDTEIVAQLRSRGASVEVYLVREGAPFVAVCVGLGDGHEWPAVTLGLGAGTERRDAIRKAVLELGQTGPFLARIWRNKEVPVPTAPEQIRTLQDHALYYCDPNHADEIHRWLDQCDRTMATLCPRDRAADATLSSTRIAVADLTPPELEESPFRVVRALGCGLQPIYYGHGFERTYTPRLSALLNDREPNLAPPPIC